MNMTVSPIITGALGTIPKVVIKGTGKLRNKRTNGDRPNYSIIKIGQNTAKSSGDLRKLAVSQTPMKNHQLTPM